MVTQVPSCSYITMTVLLNRTPIDYMPMPITGILRRTPLAEMTMTQAPSLCIHDHDRNTQMYSSYMHDHDRNTQMYSSYSHDPDRNTQMYSSYIHDHDRITQPLSLVCIRDTRDYPVPLSLFLAVTGYIPH